MTIQLSSRDCASAIIQASRPVLNINGFNNSEWYRKPRDSRKGPWLQGRYEVIDEKLWRERKPCLYFLTKDNGELKYVGISVNKIKDRWRTSPAYDANEKPLNRREMFHSQCWPRMCDAKRAGSNDTYVVSIIHDTELVEVLSTINHEISGLSVFKNDPEIAVIAMEVWFIKHLQGQLWNQRR